MHRLGQPAAPAGEHGQLLLVGHRQRAPVGPQPGGDHRAADQRADEQKGVEREEGPAIPVERIQFRS